MRVRFAVLGGSGNEKSAHHRNTTRKCGHQPDQKNKAEAHVLGKSQALREKLHLLQKQIGRDQKKKNRTNLEVIVFSISMDNGLRGERFSPHVHLITVNGNRLLKFVQSGASGTVHIRLPRCLMDKSIFNSGYLLEFIFNEDLAARTRHPCNF